LASPGEGDHDLPSAGVGPFRKLEVDEVLGGVAPIVLDSKSLRFREPAVLALPAEGDMALALYAVGEGGIYRTRASDARSFFGGPTDTDHVPVRVLSPDLPWEGTRVTGPSLLRMGAEIWMYYATSGGIGLARSSDGLTFVKDPSPIFTDDPPPEGPSVAALPGGGFVLMYGSGNDIAEASSEDGIHFQKHGVVLGPSFKVVESSLGPGEKQPFDSGKVADPLVLPRITPAGRLHVRVLYTGYTPEGTSTIGMAARYAPEGLLSRSPSAAYSVDKHEAAPALFTWSAGSMLYVQQDASGGGIGKVDAYPAIAAALAPVTVKLPTPEGFAPAP
jgi:hypothetical protein